MKILDDAPADVGAHEFAVELEAGGEPDAERVRELWKSAPGSAEFGVPHAIVRCGGGKAEIADVRAALERFNEASDNGWRWTVDALAAYLLQELCGIAPNGLSKPPELLRRRLENYGKPWPIPNVSGRFAGFRRSLPEQRANQVDGSSWAFDRAKTPFIKPNDMQAKRPDIGGIGRDSQGDVGVVSRSVIRDEQAVRNRFHLEQALFG